jgi:hypothetical protein
LVFLARAARIRAPTGDRSPGCVMIFGTAEDHPNRLEHENQQLTPATTTTKWLLQHALQRAPRLQIAKILLQITIRSKNPGFSKPTIRASLRNRCGRLRLQNTLARVLQLDSSTNGIRLGLLRIGVLVSLRGSLGRSKKSRKKSVKYLFRRQETKSETSCTKLE